MLIVGVSVQVGVQPLEYIHAYAFVSKRSKFIFPLLISDLSGRARFSSLTANTGPF